MRISEFAVAGSVEVIRDADFEALGFLSDAKPSMLVFIESPRFLPALKRVCDISCVIAHPDLATSIESSRGLAVSKTPRLAFARIHEYLVRETPFYWSDFETEIHPTAHIHPRAWVSERNVRIGADTRIDANVTVQPRCNLAEGVVIEAGAVVGSSGFQTVAVGDYLIEMTHAGSVVIGAGAKIFSNAVVAAGLFREATSIQRYARIGAGSFVSHNAQVGERSFIGHRAVINGNVKIGDDVWIGPGAVIANSLRIGNGAEITMGSAVIRDVEAGKRVSGNFAVDHRAMLRHVSGIR